MTKKFKYKHSDYGTRHSYTNNIGINSHLYKHFYEDFNKLHAINLDMSDEIFDNENLYNISHNEQTQFKNMNDFNDIRL